MSFTTFTSVTEPLMQMLQSLQQGSTQLPDFQRGWVWDDARIKDLIASVSRAFPVGTVMMLETGNPAVAFKNRAVEGVKNVESVTPARLILDGQQRLTSLYQSLISTEPVTTKDNQGKMVKRWYYMDMQKALDPSCDRIDAIVSLPENRIRQSFGHSAPEDYSTREKECSAYLFPLNCLFDWTRLNAYQQDFFQGSPEVIAHRAVFWNQFSSAVIQPFQQYQMPVITLGKSTPKEAVCLVFEKVNTGGVTLTAFELITATYAVDNFDLRSDWKARRDQLIQSPVLWGIENTDFLQTVTLLASSAQGKTITCKRKDVLELPLADYCAHADIATAGYKKAAQLLQEWHIFTARDVPYRTQFVPLAAIIGALGAEADAAGVKEKLARWFWCGVFGELYGSATETRFARDFPEVIAWIKGGALPLTVTEANFQPQRLLRLRTRGSAAYKGISALLMREGGVDLFTGSKIDHFMQYRDIDIHHIFPKSWCLKNGIPRERHDCIINKTPLINKTNQAIGGHAPSLYLASMEKSAQITSEQMDTALRTHVIEPSALRSNDFDAFFSTRQKALLERIEKAMGNSLLTIATEEPGEYDDEDEELMSLT